MDLQRRLDEYETYLNNTTTSSITTIRKYMNIVKLFLYDNMAKIERPDGKIELSIDTINSWLSFKNRTRSTAHYKYALRHYLISVGAPELAKKLVPAKKTKRKKVFTFIPKQKVENIINALEARHRLLAFLQVKTGSRVGSVLTIRSENIDFEINDHLIYIKIGVNKTLSKRSKELTLKLSKKYEQLLRSSIERPYGFIFLDQKCEAMTDIELIKAVETRTRYYNNDLAQAGRIHGIDAFSSHYLRHLFADYFLKAGGDPIYLKEAFGHAKLDTTLRYVSIADQMVDRTILAMEEN